MNLKEEKHRVELLVSFLYPGIILKGDSFTEDGEKVSNAFEPITEKKINELKASGIQKIYYDRPVLGFKGEISKPAVDQKVIDKAIDISQELENAIKAGKNLPQEGIGEVVSEFANHISSREDSVLNLLELKDFDDYTYTHSINVAMIACLMAKKMGYSEEGLKLVTTAALLHDIGKTLVPVEIVRKPAELTEEEFEIMKKHPVFGYEIIKSYSSYPVIVQKAVLLHHEKVSGKGYPLGLRGEQMGEIAQIISLADMFDAITTPRLYKPARPFWYALTEINRESGSSFSPRLSKTFVNELPSHLTEGEIFKKGSFVILNTGEIAEVIDYKYPQSLTPYINIYINSKKELVRYPIQINLQYDDSRYINSVIEDKNAIEKIMEIKNKVSTKKEIKKEELIFSQKRIEEKKEEVKEEISGDLPIEKMKESKIDVSVLKADESVLK